MIVALAFIHRAGDMGCERDRLDGATPLTLSERRPNLNAYAEGWVRSVKERRLSKVILFGER